MRVPVKKLSFLFILIMLQRWQIYAQSTTPPKDLKLLDAIESTLLNHPLIRSQQAQVEISRGSREQASGMFDSLITTGLTSNRTDLPLSISQTEQNAQLGAAMNAEQLSNNANYGIAVQRLFRNGISVNPQFQLGRTTDNLFNTGGVNTSTLSVSVIIPLIRGRGHVVAAQEQAAKTEIDASLLDLSQLMSQLMANTASSYWNLVAAQKNLAIATDAEIRGSTYLSQVQALVDADHVPRNDLHEVTANLAQRSSTRLAAEQQVFVAQEQLALDMGVSSDRIVRGLPLPADDFPDAADQELPSDLAPCMDYYADEALQRRADYLASERRYAEAKILLNAAQNRLLPQVNLNLAAGYSGLQEGRQFSDFLAASHVGVPGPTTTAGITYSFPPSNQAARGVVMQSEGTAIQAEAQSRQLARIINSAVAVSLEGLRNAILRARKARQSVEAFQSALAGEREKYAGGIGSIVDILSVEDRLTAALSDQVQSELAYALALTQFRFSTGSLIKLGQPSQTIPADTFLTLPFTCSSQHP